MLESCRYREEKLSSKWKGCVPESVCRSIVFGGGRNKDHRLTHTKCPFQKKKNLTKGFYASHVADYWPCVGGIWDVGIPGFLEAAFMLLIKIGATYFIIFFSELKFTIIFGTASVHKNPAQLP
jgi:hypothetical protein